MTRGFALASEKLLKARHNGFKRIYSNARHLLAGAALYGIEGRNLLT
jgi:hypothetical protein